MATTGAVLRIQLLGPVRAWRDGAETALGPPKQRAVLSLLASRPGDVMGVENIVDAVWGSDVPRTAVNGVHTYVAGLRRALEPGRAGRSSGAVLTSESGGYCLRVDPADVDVTLFHRALHAARRSRGQGEAGAALRLYGQALSYWRGEALSAVPGPFATMERDRLRDLRLTVVEEWAADMLAAGHHAELVTELPAAVSEEPLREKLRWLLILALYRSGRRAHALWLYEETRDLLARELGIEPGADLRTLHEHILTGHPELLAPGAGSPLPVYPGGLPPGTPGPVRLPPVGRDFVGRTEELARLEEVMRGESARGGPTTPVVVVGGTAGVGKTALVLQLAHRLVDRFPDGQLYADLRGADPERGPASAAHALEQLLGGLGVDGARVPADSAARTALYRSLLRGRRVLVVLDDAHSAEQVRPLIPRGPSGVLATSRRYLGELAARDGARLETVGPLTAREGTRLLAMLSGRRLDERGPAAERLVALCGGLPLPLRVVAQWLAANPGAPLGALLEQHPALRTRFGPAEAADGVPTGQFHVIETS
ncbi:AfsR family transcriptional regulator [Streptomyces alfalfae]|uniref:AfsR family transcriptional regulator n=1 Tax=Streptomyces alfalfae TaxID=1642299 RepID=A0ABM6H366_9ACTN|nr:AfsR/SARP family transcriptional regulator [Streptomyces alfalfae]AYA14949.1 AfsR family transcriptional regulator [Streptomyces fradiae]APY84451.1 AfsR family transcriptional regulator [Streptomyces alfalfae]APY90397.1 AfsR family transcriptional regulator [Streptomyces alfalfae]QUI29522.1 AfsR/SARP family transcriptional regulator [Streptomyces alfalfae]RXX46917.1 AfsR family transcriptional regulator [Streptomyces alfalfae]